MYCGKCNNPLVVGVGLVCQKGDFQESFCSCPFCKRIYRITLNLLRESEWTAEYSEEYIKAQRSR